MIVLRCMRYDILVENKRRLLYMLIYVDKCGQRVSTGVRRTRRPMFEYLRFIPDHELCLKYYPRFVSNYHFFL